MYTIEKKQLLGRQRLINEYDVVNFLDLPAEDLYRLCSLSADELVDSLENILKNMATYIYLTRIEPTSNEWQKFMLNIWKYPAWDFLSHTLTPPSSSDRAQIWYKTNFKQALAYMPTIKPDKEFALEFEKILTGVIHLKHRLKKLYKMRAKAFLSRRKKAQAERLIAEIFSILQFKSVGFYGIIAYAYTLYLEKSSNSLYFYQILGLKFQNRE